MQKLGGRGAIGGEERKSTDGVVGAEAEAKTIGVVQVQRIGIQDTDVHLPFFEVVGGDEANAWREGLLDLDKKKSIRGDMQPHRTGFGSYLYQLLGEEGGECVSLCTVCLGRIEGGEGEITLLNRFAANMVSFTRR